MCGILGIISTRSDQLLDRSDVLAMRDTMVDRGPDGAGFYRHRNITLAHRRLAIRDPLHGQQPWISADQRYALVYNGELYNDDQIAAQLRAEGIALRTQCDTEVLAEAWAAWGPNCVSRLRGMFAFGVVDLKTSACWLVRDRFGIKPLFYSWVDGDLVFASSIAAIRRHPRFKSAPNYRAVAHYLQTLRSTLDCQTLLDNVFTLRPAEMICYGQDLRTQRFYWQLPTTADSGLDLDEASRQIEQTLEDSVARHLKSDVEVGMMMSGGVDSNTLATMTRHQLNRSVIGVCGGGIQTDGRQQVGSDFQYARACAEHLDFDYADVTISAEQYLETWQDLVARSEGPLTTPTDAVIYHVARKLKTRCGVALGGEGADEAFCGYAVQHWSGSDYERSLDDSGLPSIARRQFRDSLVQQYGRDRFHSIAQHYLITNGLIDGAAQQLLFQPGLLPNDVQRQIEWHYQQQFDRVAADNAAQKYAGVLLNLNLESLLRRLDHATMAASLEARVPYADHLLVEQAVRLPHHLKIDVSPAEAQPWLSSFQLAQRGSLRSKRVLRKLASRLVPPMLALRPKQSFPTPLVSWLGHQWNRWVEDKLRNSEIARHFFQRSALSEVIALPDHLALWKWPVLNVVLWGERCFA